MYCAGMSSQDPIIADTGSDLQEEGLWDGPVLVTRWRGDSPLAFRGFSALRLHDPSRIRLSPRRNCVLLFSAFTD